MKIEVLYPELANLNGDMANIKYLKKCIPEVEIIETTIDKEPTFVNSDDISLVYMGTMSENAQEIVIAKLKKYTKNIKEKIANNQLFLFTGNAIEVLGKYIENEDESKIEGLNIFNIYAKRDMMHRHNSMFLGKYEDSDIIGFKSQFTMLYGDNEQNYFIKVEKGIGINKQSKLEGIKEKEFYATYLIGPFLILNPIFTLNLLKKMGVKEPELAFKEEVMEAYEIRLKKFKTI